jgi:hypothetical protein
MNIQEYDSGPTSNDLLESRVAENNWAALNDSAGGRGADGVPDVDDVPAVGTES